MVLFLKISKQEIGLITDVVQHFFLLRSMRGECVFHGNRILETEPTGQRIGENLNAVFLDMTSLYASAVSHVSFP